MLLPKPPYASSIATGRPNVRTIIDYRQVSNPVGTTGVVNFQTRI